MTLSTLRPTGQMMAYLPDANAGKLAELLVAFANSDGGAVVLDCEKPR